MFAFAFVCNFLHAGKKHKLGNFLMGLRASRREKIQADFLTVGLLRDLPNRVQTAPAVRRALIYIYRTGATGPLTFNLRPVI